MGVYQWKSGSRFGADPEKVADELTSLPDQTPEAALAFAENESTELHKCATWDDARAAHNYRLDQMRSVIRSIIITESSNETETVEYRAFEYITVLKHDDDDDEKGEVRREFISTQSALQVPELKLQIMGQIAAGIMDLQRKADVYERLSGQAFGKMRLHLQKARDEIAKETATK